MKDLHIIGCFSSLRLRVVKAGRRWTFTGNAELSSCREHRTHTESCKDPPRALLANTGHTKCENIGHRTHKMREHRTHKIRGHMTQDTHKMQEYRTHTESCKELFRVIENLELCMDSMYRVHT